RRAVSRLPQGARGDGRAGSELAVLRPPAPGNRLLLSRRAPGDEPLGPAHAPLPRLVARRRPEVLRPGPHARSRNRALAMARQGRAGLRLRRRQAHGEGRRGSFGRHRRDAWRTRRRGRRGVRGRTEEGGTVSGGRVLTRKRDAPPPW